jgi:hypothetical protein
MTLAGPANLLYMSPRPTNGRLYNSVNSSCHYLLPVCVEIFCAFPAKTAKTLNHLLTLESVILGRFDVPENRDKSKKRGATTTSTPDTIDRPSPQKKGLTLMLPNPNASLQRLTPESAT